MAHAGARRPTSQVVINQELDLAFADAVAPTKEFELALVVVPLLLHHPHLLDLRRVHDLPGKVCHRHQVRVSACVSV